MIVNENGERYVEWKYQDPVGGESIVSLPFDIYLVFVAQADSLEQLRTLVFAWPQRKTASAKRKAAKIAQAREAA